MPVAPLRFLSVTCIVTLGALYASGERPHEVGLKGPHTAAKSALLTWNVVRVGREDRRGARDVAGAVPQTLVYARALPPARPLLTSATAPGGLLVYVAVRRRRLLMGGLGRLGAG